MVAVVAGNGLGLFNASLNSLGGSAQSGLGQAGGQALVNASNGNLVLRFTDEQLSAIGQDLFHTRTYNAQGGLNDGDADGWRWEGERKVVLSGTLNTAGSTVTRTTGDGHETVYAWNGSAYKSTEGDGAHDLLTWDATNSQWAWTEGTTRTVERYEGTSGRIVSMTDRSGVVISYSYDANGRLTGVKDNASGQELVLVYDANGRLAHLDTRTAAGGALTQQVYYSYDTLGRLTTVTTDLTPTGNSIADGKVYTTTYTYDGSSFRVASVTQSDGTTASFTYVLVGSEYRIQAVTDASGTTTFAYDTTNRRTDVTNGMGQQWSYYYDAQGQLIQVQTPAVNGQRLSTFYAYDVDGNVTQITDGLGNVVSYQYDASGNRILERDSLGNTLARVFSTTNQLLNEIRYTVPATWNSATSTWTEPPASSAQVTRYVLDANNRPRYVISANGNVTSYVYPYSGLLGKEITYTDATYDLTGLTPTQAVPTTAFNNWIAARDKTKTTLVDYTYDYRGNLSRSKAYGSVDAAGAGVLDAATVITDYVYSSYGELLQTIATRGAGRTTKTTLVSTVYDGMGRITSQVDASGTRTITYTGTSRTVSTTNTAGQTVTQTFDAAGRLLSISQTAASVATRATQYVYDAMGRLTMVQDATGVRTYTFYDEAGRVSAQVDGTGAVIEYVYNAAGQRTQEKRYATLVTTSSWYNGTAVIKTLVSEIRPATIATDRTIGYAYDAAGRLSTSTDAIGTVTTYTYDGRGQLVQEQTGDRTSRYFYDASGRQVAVLDGEGFLTEKVYDAGGRLLQTIRYGAATTPANRASGTLTDLRPSTGENLQTWFFYDAAGRQIGSVDEQQFVTEVVYDEATNLQQTIRYATAYGTAITSATSFATIKTAVATGTKQTTTVAYDSMGRVSQRTAPDGTVTAYEYDTSGRLVREIRAQGTSEERSTRTRYDAFDQTIGKLLGEASARVTAGMTDVQIAAIYAQYGLTYNYDVAGRVASVTDAAGNRSVSYYDAVGRLTHVVNALGEVSETVYSAFGEVSEKTDLSTRLSTTDTAALTGGLLTTPVKTLVQAIRNATVDNRRTYGYDNRGLMTSSTDALGFLTSYGYNSFGEQTSVTRTISSGVTVTDSVSYNKRGEAIGSIEDVGGLARNTAIAYDAFGRVISRTDGRGLVSTTAYTDSGRTITSTNALSQSQSTAYDAFGRVLTSTDALGKVTTYAYDDNTRTITVTTPDGVSVSTVKTRNGETLTFTDGNGKVTTYSYNKDGQLLTTLNALNQTTTNAYDNAGRLLSVTDALNRVTSYGYDAANRVITRTDANSVVTRYTFDGQGRQVRVTEAEGKTEQRITDYAYDRSGQVLTVTQDPNGLKLTTTYTYDGLGQQVQVAKGTTASPNQQILLYTFDKLGRRTSERLDPNGVNLTTQYRYNGNDQVTRKIDPSGVSTWYVYDNAGRLTDTVDALGGVTRNAYDSNGRITSTTRFATAISSTTIATFGDAVASITPTVNAATDQTTSYIYNDLGQVRYTIDAKGGVTETVYSATGKMTKSINYTKVIPTSTPKTLVDTAAALVTVAAQARTTTYAYDDIGQLGSVTDAANKTESYTYDAVGNRKTLTNKNGAVWNYNYDGLDRLVEEITPTITVASISNTGVVTAQIRSLVTTFTYDALGQVTNRTEGRLRTLVTDPAANDDLSQARTTSYGYDAVGHQIRITSPGWYNKVTGAFQQNADTTTPANTFQVTTEVTYDSLGNAVRNRVRINNTGVAATDYVDSYKVYDLLGRLTHDVDALKGVTAYTYDAQGNTLTTKRYANALTAAVPAAGYYSSSDITATTLVVNAAQDRTLTSTYDVLGRKTAVQQDQVSLYTFTGNVATSTLITAAPTTVYTYNALGQVVRETQIARNTSGATVLTGASTYYYYDLSGNRVGAVDALGNYTRMEYDALGKLTRQVEYATKLTSWTEGTVPTAPTSTANDRSNLFGYDAMGRLTSVTQENVRYWQQSINAQSNVVSASLVTGNLTVSQTTYDGVGNALTQTDAADGVTTTSYNDVGHVTKVVEPARATAQAGAIDPFSTAAITASPITTYTVNAFGQVISETREAGKNASNVYQAGLTQTTRTQYDAAGYTLKNIDATNSAISYKVDVAGRTLEESRQTSVTLSAWTVNNVAVTRNQTIRRTYAYDLLGQQISTTDWYTAADNSQKSTVNSATYNRFGEVTSQLLNGAAQANYTYNQVGRAIQQQNAQGFTNVDYDLAGNASRSNQIGDTTVTTDDRITYTRFDLLGRALEQHLPAFEANINADTLNNVTLTLTTPIIQQTYDRWGNMLSRTDARGYVTTYTYDHNNKQLTETLPVTDILRENGTSYRASLIHEKRYDALGLLIQETDLVGPYAGVSTTTELRTRQHVYNAAGELTRDVDALGYSRNYRVDSNGNRVAIQDALGTVLVETYDAMDRQLTHGIIRNGAAVTLLTNQYDQAGRLVGETTGATAVEETLVSTAQANFSSVITGVAGNTKYTLFDERGNIVKTRNESKIERSYEYNEYNRKTKETDGLNNTLTWTFNEADFGRLTNYKDLSGRYSTYTYNKFGQLVTDYTPEAIDSVSKVKTADRFYTFTLQDNFGGAKTYAYYSNGLLKSVVESSGMSGTIAYVDNPTTDIQYNKYTYGASNSRSSTYSYDNNGNQVGAINAESYSWISGRNTNAGGYYFASENRYGFDELGRVKYIKSPAGSAMVGKVTLVATASTTIMPPNAGFSRVTWTASYQVKSIGTAAINSLEYSFDEFGNRRKTYLDSTSQSGVNQKIENWYKYDLNDQVIVAEGIQDSGTIVVGKLANAAKGYSLGYNAAGQRISSERWKETSGTTEVYERSEYTYNDLSQVLDTNLRSLVRAQGATSLQAPQSIGNSMLSLSNIYDERGQRVFQYSYINGSVDSIENYGYRGDNQKTYQESRKVVSGVTKLSQANYFNEVGMYDAAGNLRAYRYVVYAADGVTISYRGQYDNTYVGFDSYKQSTITSSWTKPGTPSTSVYAYGVRGELQEVIVNGSAVIRRFSSDRDGKLIARQESNGTAQNYIYFQGTEVANVGNASGAMLSDTFMPISEAYPSSTPTSYIVNQGDTLAKIASAVWGDSSMWYLIADANGLSATDELIPGSSLQIPNVVSSTRNTATNFKPYNADEVIGNTTVDPQPLPPPVPKPKKKKCGGVASIVMVVVAVVAAVFTAGAGLALAGGMSLGAAVSAGATAVVTAGVGLGSAMVAAGGWAGAGIALAAGAVGSAASQLVGKSMGVVDKFSWSQVAVGGLTSAATFGLGYVAGQGAFGATVADGVNSLGRANAGIGNITTGYASLGVFGYAGSYAANKIVGLDTTFSWKGVAASTVGGAVSGVVSSQTNFNPFIKGQVNAFSSAAIADKWFGGGNPDYGRVAADAFGNTFADFILNSIRHSPENSLTNNLSVGPAELLAENPNSDQIQGFLSTDTPPPPEKNILVNRGNDHGGSSNEAPPPDPIVITHYANQEYESFSIGDWFSDLLDSYEGMGALFGAHVNSDTDLLSTRYQTFNTGYKFLDAANATGDQLYNLAAAGVNAISLLANIVPVGYSAATGRSFEQASGDILAMSASTGPQGVVVGQLLTSATAVRAAAKINSLKAPKMGFTGAGETVINVKAERSYAEIRLAHMDDVPIVAESTGLSVAETTALKKHLFFGKHSIPLEGGLRFKLSRFAADDEIAFAWQAAQNGVLPPKGQSWFRQLADHELGERALMAKGVPYRDPAAWDSNKKWFGSTPPGAHDLAPLQPDYGTFPGFEPTF
jgi:YD repeat-containing protein